MSFQLPKFQDLPDDLQQEIKPRLEELKVLGALPHKSNLELQRIHEVSVEIRRRVLEHVRTNFKPDSVISPKLGLQNVQITRYEKAVAEAQLFFTPWSENFVHGPDTLLSVTNLAERLMKPNEKLAQLVRISWRQPIKYNLNLCVGGVPERGEFEEPVVLDGAFVTNHQRLLHFYATETDTAIDVQSSNNPFAQQILGNYSVGKAFYDQGNMQHVQTLQALGSDMIEDLQTSAPSRMATITEVIALGVANILGHRKAFRLMAGFKGIELPEAQDFLFQENDSLGIRFLHNQKRQSRMGFELLPFEIALSYQKKAATGLLAYTLDSELAKKFL